MPANSAFPASSRYESDAAVTQPRRTSCPAMTQATQNVIPELAAVACIWSSTKLRTSDVTITETTNARYPLKGELRARLSGMISRAHHITKTGRPPPMAAERYPLWSDSFALPVQSANLGLLNRGSVHTLPSTAYP